MRKTSKDIFMSEDGTGSEVIAAGLHCEDGAVVFRAQEFCAGCLREFSRALSDALCTLCRKINGSDRVRGNGDVELETGRSALPGVGDSAMNGIIVGANPIDRRMVRVAVRRWRHRLDEDVLVSWAIAVDTDQGSEHPFANRAK